MARPLASSSGMLACRTLEVLKPEQAARCLYAPCRQRVRLAQTTGQQHPRHWLFVMLVERHLQGCPRLMQGARQRLTLQGAQVVLVQVVQVVGYRLPRRPFRAPGELWVTHGQIRRASRADRSRLGPNQLITGTSPARTMAGMQWSVESRHLHLLEPCPASGLQTQWRPL
jgi:hypothetical protein